MKKIHYISLFLFLAFFASCRKDDLARNYDYKLLGTSANHLLSASTYSKLAVEIHYMPGFKMDTSIVAGLVRFLNIYINKPSGIEITQYEIQSSGKTYLTLQEIVRIENSNRTLFTQGNTIVVHFTIADSYYNNDNTLAVSYWNTSICLFGKTINENSGNSATVSRNRLLANVMQHEIGHLLGLVNQGTPMLHNHAAPSGDHCSSTSCLMYTEIETDASAMLRDMPVFDTDCLNDLRANGGK